MNKKILIMGIATVFMLLVISFTSTVSSNIGKPIENKESPLFGIRIGQAIKKKLIEIKTNFLSDRLLLSSMPLLLKNKEDLPI